MRTHFCMELRPKIGGSYRSFKTRHPRLSLGVTDFILLRPCGKSFTGYQLMKASSSKCCSWPSRVWKISFLLTCLTFSSSMSQGEKICALGMNIFFVFHVLNVLLVTCSFYVAGPLLWNSLPSHIRFSPSVSVFKKSLKTHLFPSNCFAFFFYLGIISLCFFKTFMLLYIMFIIFDDVVFKLCYILYVILPILKFYCVLLMCFIMYSAVISLE